MELCILYFHGNDYVMKVSQIASNVYINQVYSLLQILQYHDSKSQTHSSQMISLPLVIQPLKNNLKYYLLPNELDISVHQLSLNVQIKQPYFFLNVPQLVQKQFDYIVEHNNYAYDKDLNHHNKQHLLEFSHQSLF